ncbi:hypothetical protein HPP92_021794 [Vanilla planifolia]|uniref:Amino acid transporter transmembrane domain-containing protein n=1 Tax=Vanilla planifolia TaxID=51239 RepID=A0A835UH61_VANPL|nr:hypothetical protein HPP92_021794 [Vanilla planifolia]
MALREIENLEASTLAHLELDDDGRPRRTGTLWSASAHIITAVIGSGVLSLAWTMAQLGWLIGPLALFVFSLITLFTSRLLADCYRSADSGKRNYNYMSAIKSNLGNVGITSMTGTEIGNDLSKTDKVWNAFQALGNMAFAYSYAMVLIEIQDTLKSPPAENKVMKKATLMGVITTTVFYMLCGFFGYAAFGNKAPGNLLTGFYGPFWLINIANVCIVVHLLGAYQVDLENHIRDLEHELSDVDAFLQRQTGFPRRGGLLAPDGLLPN